jgi:nitric oxide reductase subunit B
MMVGLSLFPSGVLQLWDVLQNGYWHARSLDFIGSERARTIEWMRMPGDVVFIVFGAVPLLIAATKAWMGVRGRRVLPLALPPVVAQGCPSSVI